MRYTENPQELKEYSIKPVRSLLGRKHGRNLPKVLEAIANLEKSYVSKLVNDESIEVLVDGSPVEVLPGDIEAELVPLDGYSLAEEPGLLVGVSTIITEDLKLEGLARDIVRRIQALRKEADFEIDDEIETYYSGDAVLEKVFAQENDYIAAETLSKSVMKGNPPDGAHVEEYKIEGLKLKLGLKRLT